MHDHSPTGANGMYVLLAVPFVLAIALYVCAVVTESRRGRRWPWTRTSAWLGGVAAAAVGVLGPLAAGHPSFAVHMWSHLLAGMAAPLLLVLAAPMTLALRALHVRRARQVSRVLRSWPARLVMMPAVAGALSVVSVWALYFTELYPAMQQAYLLHLAVSTHVVVVGVLFTAAVIAVDPSPHRAGFTTRMTVLVAVLAAHSILAKLLYASPPSEVTVAETGVGAMVMYYGGGVIDACLIVILCTQWYRQAGRRRHRESSGSVTTARRLLRRKPLRVMG